MDKAPFELRPGRNELRSSSGKVLTRQNARSSESWRSNKTVLNLGQKERREEGGR